MKAIIGLAIVAPFLIAARDPIAGMRDEARHDRVALDIVRDLTTEVGPRMPGTTQDDRARAWAVSRLTSLGFKNVHVEPFSMPVWVRGEERATVLAPYPQDLRITALGNSGSTGPSGISGDIIAFNSLADLRAAPNEAVRGRIVYVTERMPRTEDNTAYPIFGATRRAAPSIAASKGASAILIRSIATDSSRSPHTGTQTWAAGVTPIPAAALAMADADQLDRIVAGGKPVRVSLLVTPRTLGVRQSGNVVAEVPGREPNAGVILVGGHLDSWDLGTGALDDGAGIAIVTAAAKHVMEAGVPRRTIRIVWFGSEEIGTYGAKAYGERHRGEKHALAMESDDGADRPTRFTVNVHEEGQPAVQRLTELLRPLGVLPGGGKSDGGGDVGVMVEQGASAMGIQQDLTRYFDFYHSAEDTFDKIDPDQLAQAVAAWTCMLAVTSGYDGNF